jgi:hypothetical protein
MILKELTRKLLSPDSSSMSALPEEGSDKIILKDALTFLFREGCIVLISFRTCCGTTSLYMGRAYPVSGTIPQEYRALPFSFSRL